MRSLLNDLDKHAGKTAYQTYTVSHGIESLTVLVPLNNAPAFEEDFGKIEPVKSVLLEVISRHGGKLRS